MRSARIAATLALAAAALPASGQAIRISEFMSNAPGADEGREFFEISGPAGASLQGIWLLEIDGDGGAGGNIDAAFNLSSLSLGSNGLLLLRDQSEITLQSDAGPVTAPAVLSPAPAPGTTVFVDGNNIGDYNNNGVFDAADYTVWRDAFESQGTDMPEFIDANDATPESVTQSDYDAWANVYGTPPQGGFFNEDGGGIENGSITFALVRNFTATRDFDVDTDDDGILDFTPWSEVLDAVGFDEDGPLDDSSNRSYAAEMGGFEFDGSILNGGVPGFGDEPDGYVLLADGTPAVFDADDPENLFLNINGQLFPIATSDLGPYSIDDSNTPGEAPELIALDSNGDLRFVDPTEVELTAADVAGAPPTATIVDELSNPVSLFLLTPGSPNGSGVVGDIVVVPDPEPMAAAGVPEPTAAVLAALTLAGLARRR